MTITELLRSEQYLALASQFPKKGRRKEKLIAAFMANNPYPLDLSKSPIEEVVCPEQYFINRYTNHEPDVKRWLYHHLGKLVSDEDICSLFGIEGSSLTSWNLAELIRSTQIALYDGWVLVNPHGKRIKGSSDCVDAESLRHEFTIVAINLRKGFSIEEQYPYPLDYAKTTLHFIRWGKPDKPPLW